jgi:hypothetical protein
LGTAGPDFGDDFMRGTNPASVQGAGENFPSAIRKPGTNPRLKTNQLLVLVAVPFAIPQIEVVLLSAQSLGVPAGAADVAEPSQAPGSLHTPLLVDTALHDHGVFLQPVCL